MTVEITADMVIHDVVSKYPQTVKVFQGHGLPCTACQVGARETVAAGARTHRLAVESLLGDLNRVANGQEAEGIKPATKAPVGRGIPLNIMSQGASSTGIRNIVAIMSGKGGVGKSLVTGLIAISLQRQGLKVGILDGDITGPSIAKEFGVRGVPTKSEGGIDALRSVGGIKIVSMNMFLPDATDPVVWRGPMISSAIKQFYSDVDWGKLDFLLVDLPPGTSDEAMTVMQSLPVDGVVIVSSPQMLATEIVVKCIKMVQTMKGKVIGLVENMAYLTMPDGSRNELFGPSNGAELVAMTGAPLLAQLPIDPEIAMLCDAGKLEDYNSDSFDTLASNFTKSLKLAAAR
ncbi:MAG TPA: P-loop NTPase [Ktedonobacterales bacterium]|jgi:hybrid cluster-associated redox disulfide protein|nr:P-loop NTPase [Ktedonobacterales bacterium]